MNKQFFAAMRPIFGGKLTQGQVDGLSGIVAAFDQVGNGDRDALAYILATVYHETGKRMERVREGFAKSNAGAIQAVANLAKKRGPNSAPAKYGKPAGPYGHVYYGRGYPQLTWLENYQAASDVAGVDLVKDPDAMLDPVISARVLVWGILSGKWNAQGKGFAFYEGADGFLSDAEAVEARRTVNGTDQSVKIAGYHRVFYNALGDGGWAPAPSRSGVISDAPREGFLIALLRSLGFLSGKGV